MNADFVVKELACQLKQIFWIVVTAYAVTMTVVAKNAQFMKVDLIYAGWIDNIY